MKLNKVQIGALICLAIGLIIFIVGFAMLNFDITKLSTETAFRAKNYISSEPVRAICIDDRNADIEVSPSEDDKVHITYFVNDKEYYDISETEEGDLNIQSKSRRKWYDYLFNFQFEQPKLLVGIPENYNGDITVRSHDGYIQVKEIGVDDLFLTASNHEIQIQNVSASGRLEAKTSDANIYINDSKAAGDIACHTYSGKIDLDAVEGKTIDAENSDGRIALKKVISKESILLKTLSDDIRLDTVEFSEELTCNVTDGSVKGSVTGKLADYSVTAKAIDGKSNLPESMDSGDKIINIKTSSGDINIDFIK